MDEFEFDAFALTFNNKTINDKYMLTCRRSAISYWILMLIFSINLTVLPILSQIRFLKGSFGFGWCLTSWLYIGAACNMFFIIILEFCRNKVEKMEISRRQYYYKLMERSTVLYNYFHYCCLSIGLYLLATRLCTSQDFKSIYDKVTCNNSGIKELPWDHFFIGSFFSLLYRSIFTFPIIHTYIGQTIQVSTVLLILYQTLNLEVPSTLLYAIIIGALQVFSIYALYLQKFQHINQFINENRSRSFDSQNYPNNYNLDERSHETDSSIFYHGSTYTAPLRKGYSEYRDDKDDTRSTSSSITSVDLSF